MRGILLAQHRGLRSGRQRPLISPTDYGGFICESFGAFGKEAWDFITKIDDRELVGGDADGYSPWGRPAWKRHCILAVGFAIQRGNTAMLVRSDVRRRSHTHKFSTSGPSSHHIGG